VEASIEVVELVGKRSILYDWIHPDFQESAEFKTFPCFSQFPGCNKTAEFTTFDEVRSNPFLPSSYFLLQFPSLSPSKTFSHSD
jgi:hypothetical protein